MGATEANGEPPPGTVPWKDLRFTEGVEKVRKVCNVPENDREDDAMIGMLLDRFKWDYEKVTEMYRKSIQRRSELKMSTIKDHIVKDKLTLEDFPHHTDVGRFIPIFASSSTERTPVVPSRANTKSASSLASESSVVSGADPASVIGCYEMRYGQGDTSDATEKVSPADFTEYMLYVTQWRWIQCEEFARKHGELGFWSMVHDLSCPQGFLSVWSKARNVFNKYMAPVDEACSGLFPPMVQKILVVNVPRMFSPIWAIISMVLPEQHKERIVLLSTSKTTAAELSKYMPYEHLPPHVRDGPKHPVSASPSPNVSRAGKSGAGDDAK